MVLARFDYSGGEKLTGYLGDANEFPRTNPIRASSLGEVKLTEYMADAKLTDSPPRAPKPI